MDRCGGCLVASVFWSHEVFDNVCLVVAGDTTCLCCRSHGGLLSSIPSVCAVSCVIYFL